MFESGHKINKLIHAAVESIYQQSEGFQSYSDSQKSDYLAKDICYIYGELLYPSTLKLANKLKLSSTDTLLDLGSGLGKFALQIFLSTEVGQVIGIEATEPLYTQSKEKLAIAQRALPIFWEGGRSIDFQHGNFLYMDWSMANIVYSCSTCFTKELLGKIGHKINDTANIKQALSFRPLHTLERLKCKAVFRVECSWDSALCFWYSESA